MQKPTLLRSMRHIYFLFVFWLRVIEGILSQNGSVVSRRVILNENTKIIVFLLNYFIDLLFNAFFCVMCVQMNADMNLILPLMIHAIIALSL